MAVSNQNEETTNDANPVGEASPLLQPSVDVERLPPTAGTHSLDDSDDEWLANEDVQFPDEQQSRSSWYMVLLTLSLAGYDGQAHLTLTFS